MRNLGFNGAVHRSGWYAQHSIDPEAELEDVELLGRIDG